MTYVSEEQHEKILQFRDLVTGAYLNLPCLKEAETDDEDYLKSLRGNQRVYLQNKKEVNN